MDILVVADGHYYRDQDNQVYVESVFDYNFYKRYLSVFDNVYAIVRTEQVITAPEGMRKASGEHVYFLDLPSTRGVREIIKEHFRTRKLICQYVGRFECAIFRLPGVVSNMACKEYMKMGKKYGVEVVVDPWEYFSKGSGHGISRIYARYAWTRFLKAVCLDANGVSYVTERYLQDHYPCKAMQECGADGHFTSAYSSVELPDDGFAHPRVYQKKQEYVLSHVANAFTGYGKGHLILMDAVKMVRQEGYNVRVIFVGDGPLREDFESYAKQNGIGGSVTFTGRLPDNEAVKGVIRESDLFVFPTMAEGLPRVVLEAMAEGLPVIASPVCGIPEILPEECLVDYKDVQGYANAIIKMFQNPDYMTKCSWRNVETARQFRSSVLNARRKEFYTQLKELI